MTHDTYIRKIRIEKFVACSETGEQQTARAGAHVALNVDVTTLTASENSEQPV